MTLTQNNINDVIDKCGMKTQTGLSWRELVNPEINVWCPWKAKGFLSILLTISLSADHTVVLADTTAWEYNQLNTEFGYLGPNKTPDSVLCVWVQQGRGNGGKEKTTGRGTLWSVLFTKSCSDDQI